MSQDVEKLIDNEKEWRRYLVQKIDKMESDLNSFKLKMTGLLAIMVAIAEVISKNL